MRNIINQIKWAYQRVVRGYDDRIMWGFDGYFEDTFIPPLKEFCEKQLFEVDPNLNPARFEVYKETLRLIENGEEDIGFSRLIEYFGKHVGYYWT